MLSTKQQLTLDAMKCGVPIHDIDGLVRYAFEGVPVGDFLEAVLENNLMEAYGRADETNTYAMLQIVTFVYNYMPAPCHGSPEKVAAWIKWFEDKLEKDSAKDETPT